MDGRIHPARIETVEKSRKEVESIIKQEGESATFETGVHGLHPELIKLLGKLKFRTSYGQNVLKHSIEVSHLAGVMAGELKRRCHLQNVQVCFMILVNQLTMKSKAHTLLSAQILQKYRENKDVVHAIMAHHGGVEAQTIVASLVQAADAISAARPGARRENLETYIKRLQNLEEIANSFDSVEKSFAIQAGREIRIMVKPEKVNDEGMILVAKKLLNVLKASLNIRVRLKLV